MNNVTASMNLVEERLKVEGRNFDLFKWAPAIPEVAAATIQVAIVGPDGRLVATTADPHAGPMDLSDREHIRVHMNNPNVGIFVGQPVIGRVSHQLTIQITKRLTWADGSFAGVLLFSVDPRLMTALHEEIDLGNGGVITLVGEDGVIRGRYTKAGGNMTDPNIGRRVASWRVLKAAAKADKGDLESISNVDGVTRLYDWRRVTGYPLIVLVGLGRDEALATTNHFTSVVVVLASFLTFVLGSISLKLHTETRRRAANETMLVTERARLAGAVEDLATERVKLVRSEEHLARAQRISGVGSVVRDYQTGKSECSQEFYRIFGIDPDGPLPAVEDVLKMVHPDDRPAAKAAARASIAAAVGAEPLEYRIVRPSGEVRVVYREMEVTADDAGRQLCRVLTFKDITELRAAQEREKELNRQLMHAQKLEALGTLAGGIAHDLNNTLVPILALTKLVQDDLAADDPLREDTTTIICASERARGLVKQILAFSRKQDRQRQAVDLAAVTREALAMLRASVPATITIDGKIADVPAVIGDPNEFHQVIVNLVTNAAHAIGANQGAITIAVAAAGENIGLSVGDTGCGMDSATIDRLFEPFFTTKAVGEGTGLGLSVVHGIVSACGGRIEVNSSPGKGSTFIVVLPVAAPAMVAFDAA